MSTHEQFADDLSLYALGVLPDQERLVLEQHLKDCSRCRQELEELRGGMGLLAFSISGAKPPVRARERLMAAIAKEPKTRPGRAVHRTPWWRPLEWAIAASAVVVVFMLASQNGELRRQLASLQFNMAKQQVKLEQAENFVASLTSPEAEHFTLIAAKTPPQPQGKVIYSQQQGTLVLLASNMPELPPEKTYELWLIPKSGAPIPAGLFKPDRHGSAVVAKPPLPTGTEAQTFAITVEPAAGSPAPTSKPIMVGEPG